MSKVYIFIGINTGWGENLVKMKNIKVVPHPPRKYNRGTKLVLSRMKNIKVFQIAQNDKKHIAAILYLSSYKACLWLVFTLFSLFLLAEHFVQFGMAIGKLA